MDTDVFLFGLAFHTYIEIQVKCTTNFSFDCTIIWSCDYNICELKEIIAVQNIKRLTNHRVFLLKIYGDGCVSFLSHDMSVSTLKEFVLFVN